jgi:hypothetical protein
LPAKEKDGDPKRVEKQQKIMKTAFGIFFAVFIGISKK